MEVVELHQELQLLFPFTTRKLKDPCAGFMDFISVVFIRTFRIRLLKSTIPSPYSTISCGTLRIQNKFNPRIRSGKNPIKAGGDIRPGDSKGQGEHEYGEGEKTKKAS